MNPITQYTEFRTYLSDWCSDRKARGAPISNRWIAGKMEINSTSWFTNVRNGTVGLSAGTIGKLSRLIKHTPFERQYFETMVLFNQATILEERSRYYNELMSLRQVNNARRISSDEYEYFATWYHPVIRAMIDQIRFCDDYKTLASMIRPAISTAQAKKSVELLERLGLIGRNQDQYYHITSAAVTTGAHGTALAVSSYQQETLRLAQEAIDRFPVEERDISTLTIGISGKSIEAIRAILTDARQKIIQVAVGDSNEDSVYQVNFQLFPVGQLNDKVKRKG